MGRSHSIEQLVERQPRQISERHLLFKSRELLPRVALEPLVLLPLAADHEDFARLRMQFERRVQRLPEIAGQRDAGHLRRAALGVGGTDRSPVEHNRGVRKQVDVLQHVVDGVGRDGDHDVDRPGGVLAEQVVVKRGGCVDRAEALRFEVLGVVLDRTRVTRIELAAQAALEFDADRGRARRPVHHQDVAGHRVGGRLARLGRRGRARPSHRQTKPRDHREEGDAPERENEATPHYA